MDDQSTFWNLNNLYDCNSPFTVPYIVLYTSMQPTDTALRLSDAVVKMGPHISDWKTIKNRLMNDHQLHPGPFNNTLLAAWRWPEMEFIPGLSNVTEAVGLEAPRVMSIISDSDRLSSFWKKDAYEK